MGLSVCTKIEISGGCEDSGLCPVLTNAEAGKPGRPPIHFRVGKPEMLHFAPEWEGVANMSAIR